MMWAPTRLHALLTLSYACFRMVREGRITVSINNSVVGIGGNIIEQLRDGLICMFCGGYLLRDNFTKGHKDFAIDSTCVLQETSNNFLDAFYYSGVQGRNWFRFSCILSLGPKINFNMAMWWELSLVWVRMIVSEKEPSNVIFHREATSAFLIFPV